MSRQGAARHAVADRGNDFYETPPEATRALVRCMSLPRTIWEPAAGRGAIVRELTAAGHDVVATDLVAHPGADAGITSGVDFLMEWKVPPGVEAVITNPPYKNADAFIRKGLSLGLPVIVLLRLMALEGQGRSDIVDSHLHDVFAGIERLPMMHRDGWEGPKSGNAVPFAWFSFRPEKRTGPIALHRISWRT